jgi:hypothetical protein
MLKEFRLGMCGPGQINQENPMQYLLPRPIKEGTSELRIESKILDTSSELAPTFQFAR